jgi:hypothetical protein
MIGTARDRAPALTEDSDCPLADAGATTANDTRWDHLARSHLARPRLFVVVTELRRLGGIAYYRDRSA